MLRSFLSIRTLLLATVGVAALAGAYFGIRNLASLDPFAEYKEIYLSPFGAGIGSVMTDVDVSVYEEGNVRAYFNAGQVQIRRDQQHLRLTLLKDGRIYDNGNLSAEFEAGIATYEAATNRIEVAGAPRVKNESFDVTGARVVIDQAKKTVTLERGVEGTYKGGKFRGDSFVLDYDTNYAMIEGVRWSGPLENWELLDVGGQAGKRQVNVRASRSEYLTNPDREVHHDAEMVDRDYLIRATKITFDRSTDILIAEGRVEYHGPDAIVSAPKVVVYRKERRALATGEVRMFVKPEKDKNSVTSVAEIPPAQPNLPPHLQRDEQKDPGQDPRKIDTARKYPIVVTCTRIEYFYTEGSKRAIMTGNPKARQTLKGDAWRELSAPTVIYEEEKEILTLLSETGGLDVRLKNSLGDDLIAEILVISTKENDQWMTGKHVSGKLEIEEDELPTRRGGGGG